MKKIFVLLIGVCLTLCLVGCDIELSQEDFPTSNYVGTVNNVKYTTSGNIVYIWTDTETGVQYLIFSEGRAGGITPRLNADGTLYIVEEGAE